jgi:hypothetical protein
MLVVVSNGAAKKPSADDREAPKPLDVEHGDLVAAIQRTLEQGMREERKPREKKFEFGEGVQEPEE